MSYSESKPRTHYHYSISLRVFHPSADPELFTEALDMEPNRCWKAGAPRQTPTGVPLDGAYPNTYWYKDIAAGRWPIVLNVAIYDTLKKLTQHRAFFHKMRTEGGRVEFSIGWSLENQTGDVLTHECLALAADLQIDLYLDIYPPDQPQNEYKVGDDILLH